MALEHTEHNAGNKQVSREGDAKSGAVEAVLTDPELAKVVAAWPNLPGPIRRAILALIS